MSSLFEYSDGESLFEGYVAYDSRVSGTRAAILVGHAWDGPNERLYQLTDDFAKQGFCAFAIDVYGKGVRGRIDGDNSHLMNPLLADRAVLRRRLLAAMATVRAHDLVANDQILMIGHCFGGLCALDLARAAPAGLLGVISVHGPLAAPKIGPQPPIPASVLVLHGWDDPFAPPSDVIEFAREMTAAGADWQLHAYGNAKHAFTFVGADIPQYGVKYDAKAHQRSTQAIRNFTLDLVGRSGR
jgi:dienelactone hydrolase